MMKKLLKTGISFLKLLNDKPKVYWWSMINEKKLAYENFGDFLTPYIVEKLTNKKPILVSPKSKFSFFFKHSLMIGSIISRSQKRTLVWGSGIIKKDDLINGGNFLAVRGPKTAQRIKDLGYASTEVYGDPALLLPILYNPKIEKKYTIGIIPHFFHYEELVNVYPEKDKTVLFINLLTNNVEDVINQILSCEKIISTSLHGLIVAHAYQIPAIWWKYGKLNGDDIKFYDYLESLDLKINSNFAGLTLDEVMVLDQYNLPDINKLVSVRKGLLKTFPYKLNKNFLE